MRSKALAQSSFAALFVLLGALGFFFALRFKSEAGYAGVSSRFFPFVISAGLLGCGLMLLWQALRGGFKALEDDGAAPAWREGAWALGSLVVYTLCIAHIGFVLASAALFAGVARGFGSKRPLVDFLIGLALALPVYQMFARGLNVNLPALFKGFF